MRTGRCVNVSAAVQAGALRTSVVIFTLTLAAAVAMALLDVRPIARVALFVPFYVAVHTAFMSLFGVCGNLARAGARNLDGRVEKVFDTTEMRELRRTGLRVTVGAVVVAALGTALFVISP